VTAIDSPARSPTARRSLATPACLPPGLRHTCAITIALVLASSPEEVFRAEDELLTERAPPLDQPVRVRLSDTMISRVTSKKSPVETDH
jgi:hypothetical protein